MSNAPEYAMFVSGTGGRPRNPDSFASWLRSLTAGEPAQLPERFADRTTNGLTAAMQAATKRGEGKFAYRTIDGLVWVCRLRDEGSDDE